MKLCKEHGNKLNDVLHDDTIFLINNIKNINRS